jgi:energy-coupling factor transporter ATP-binding protein EcfA2
MSKRQFQSSILPAKRVKLDPTHPLNSIHLDIEASYHADKHAYFDTKEGEVLKLSVRKQTRSLRDFDDSNLSDEQQRVRLFLLDMTNTETVLITGEAGSGKTHVQLSVMKALKKEGRNVFRIGPTHGSIANLPDDSSTYQTFFSMPPSIDYLDTSMRGTHLKDMKSAALRHSFIQRMKHRQEQSILIIEEAGMISKEVIDLIFGSLALIAPGKFRVFLFFDILQLAPVEGMLLVESKNIQNATTLLLKTNMRQTEEEEDFLDLLRSIAKNKLDDSHLMMLRSRRMMEGISQVPTRRLCARNITVDMHNLAHLNSLPGDKFTFRALDIALKKMPDYGLARSSRWLSWGVGAKIVFESTPLHEMGLYNGITGTIIDIVKTDTDMVLPVIHVDKYGLDIVVHPWKEDIMTEAIGATAPTVQAERTQFPFSIAEATTVHKVQGLTLHGPVEIDMKDMTSPGQIYTAFSRLTKLENLFIKNLPANRLNGGIDGLRVSEIATTWCREVGLG